MSKENEPRKTTQPGVSRRGFLETAAKGGAAVAALGAAKRALAETTDATADSIHVSEDFTAARAQTAKPAEFPMNGAEVFARACREEGLAALFCAPGNYAIINAIATEGIPTYGGRTEGGMCAAADGFIRVTGEIAACSGTEGPGFTNMIMNIGAANAARTPLLVLASNMTVSGDDTESNIQRGYQQPTTEGLKKWGKRLIDPKRVWEYAAYAFRNLRSGVPRPVHLDFPGEVARARFESASDLEFFYDKTRYRTDTKPHPGPADLAKVVEMMKKAERPMIVASTGCFYDRAWDALKVVAEKADIAVVESGPSRGHFSDAHPLSASTAPDALLSVDLVILVGQYCMPSIGEYAFDPEAKWIRVDPDPSDIGRNVPIDLGIVAGERAFLEALAEALPSQRRDAWRSELAAARAKFEKENEEYTAQGWKHSAQASAVHPAVIGQGIADLLYKGAVPKEQTLVVSGGYGIARATRRYLRAYRPGQILNGAYQYGAIGPDVGYTVGAGAAVQQGVGPHAPYKGAPMLAITGDAGMGYSGMEIETLGKYKMPVVLIVYNNNAWGVWQSGTRSPRSLHMYLFQENLRYDKVAEGLGARGEYVTKAEDFLPTLKKAWEVAEKEGLSTLINCQARKEFWTNEYPPGMPQKVEPGCMAYYH